MHLLVRFPTTISVSDFVGRVKGATSYFVTHLLDSPFRWQGGYGAFTVSRRHVDAVSEYVLNQEHRHRERLTHDALERVE